MYPYDKDPRAFIDRHPVLGWLLLTACLTFLAACTYVFVTKAWELDRQYQEWEKAQKKETPRP